MITTSASPINLDTLINLICEKADRLKSRRAKGQGGKKESTNTDEALSATASDDGKRRHCKGKCHNCGKMGHWAKECRSPKKDKEESASTQTAQAPSTSFKPENKPVGAANVIYNFEGDGFWMATEETADCTYLVSAEPDLMLDTTNKSEDVPHREGENERDLGEDEWTAAVTSSADNDFRICTELYDSGAT